MSGDTPFAKGELAELIGYDGDEEAVEAILDGSFEWEKREGGNLLHSKEMHTFLKNLQRPISPKTKEPIQTMEDLMTPEDYQNAFNNTRESTSSHPPLHYGHFKAACESPILTEVNLAFMNLPFKYGYPLSRWLHSHHCMLQKKEQPWIHKLRIVQLFEADFNTALKFLMGRRLMRHSEINEINSHQLYGSRKGKSSIERA